MSSPHALVLPWPAQGHIIPLMHLSHFLSNHGFKITFLNTEHNHNLIVRAQNESCSDRIRMISIPDGFGPDEDRRSHKLITSIRTHMQSRLQEVIKERNEREDDKITCMIVDTGMTWALKMAEKTGIRSVVFCPESAACLAVTLSIPKLIADGVIDENGRPKKQDIFRLTPTTPPMNTTDLVWNNLGNREVEKFIFQRTKNNHLVSKGADFFMCNSFRDLELPIFNNFPNILPIGPLPLERVSNPLGHFWSNDESCLNWLDQQPINSVVYVSFGSISTVNQTQFQELALGLEMSRMPFLWITRPDSTNDYDDEFLKEFKERTKEKGKFVGWSNQEKVLAHSSIACFLSHCGWNSTMDAVKNGVPILCWAFVADQFANQTYICDVLEIGLKLVKNKDEIVSKENISAKLAELMANEKIKARAEEMKKMAKISISKGGSSFTNLCRFVEAMKL